MNQPRTRSKLENPSDTVINAVKDGKVDHNAIAEGAKEVAAKLKKAKGAKAKPAEASSGAAQLGEAKNVEVNVNEVIIVGIDTPPPVEGSLLWPLYQAHRNTKPINKAQVESVKRNGVMEPILLMKGAAELGKELDGKLILLAGRQRTRWGRQAAIELKRAVMAPGRLYEISANDAKTMLDVMVTENWIGADDDVIEKAEEAARYCQMTGESPEKAALIFAVSGQQIRNYIAVATLCHDKIKRAIRKGELTLTAGVKLAKLAKVVDGSVNYEKQLAAFDDAMGEAEEETQAEGSKTKRGKARGKTKKRSKASKKVTAKAENTEFPRPGKRLLSALAESNYEIEGSFQAVLEWILGARSTVAIKGLSAAIKKIEGGKE